MNYDCVRLSCAALQFLDQVSWVQSASISDRITYSVRKKYVQPSPCFVHYVILLCFMVDCIFEFDTVLVPFRCYDCVYRWLQRL